MIDDAYQAFDIVLEISLIASDSFKLPGIVTHDSSRKQFCFSPAPTKEQMIRFYSGKAQVPTRRFAETLASPKGAEYTMSEFA